jgi:hypothetical protein
MRTWMPRGAIPLMLLAGCLAGCQHSSSYPSDPLLVSNKPINARPEMKPPVVVSYNEPDAPAGPVEAVASSPLLGPASSTEVTVAAAR